MWARECRWQVLRDGDIIFEVPMMKDGNGAYGYNVGMTIGYNEDRPDISSDRLPTVSTSAASIPSLSTSATSVSRSPVSPKKYDEDLNQEADFGKSCVSGWNIGKVG